VLRSFIYEKLDTKEKIIKKYVDTVVSL